MARNDLRAAIKEMEAKKREEAFKNIENQTPEKVNFSVWFYMRSEMIPKQHVREVIWADFKGRGLSDTETMEVFDNALRAYGIRLK